MALQSLFVRMAGRSLRPRGQVVSMGWGLGVLVAIVGVGAGAAHAQWCDPVRVAKLLPADGAEGDLFGKSVSLSGDTAVIGALEDTDNGIRSGSAYVFTWSGGVWTEQAKLLSSDGEGNDRFGFSVSISGDTAVIGAYQDDDNGRRSGSAYIFTRSGSVWTEQVKLLPADGAEDDYFGEIVSISGDTVIIGAYGDDDNGLESGSAYIFTRNEGEWTQQAKLLSSDGAEGDHFGGSVSIYSDTIVIGANKDDDNGTDSGSAYVFTRSEGVWTEEVKLSPGDGANGDRFGFSNSISGDTAIIGAWFDNDNGTNSGSAYIFTRSEGEWTQQAKILPVDGAAYDRFGSSVSISGDTAVIGASWADHYGSESGTAYVFMWSGGVWTQYGKLLPGDGARYDYFGQSVSISDDTAVVGAFWHDDNGSNSGSAYVFDLHCDACHADLNDDGVVNTQDFLVFVNAWAAGDLLADWNNDGEVNTSDFSIYFIFWNFGCP